MDKKKILIIDDEVSFTKMLKLILERTDRYEVKTENRGKQALSVTKEFMPDLIFLDIVMPDVSGSEVAVQLMNDKEVKNIPVVFLTALVTPEETSAHNNMIGNRPFLAKPVATEAIIQCIEKYTK